MSSVNCKDPYIKACVLLLNHCPMKESGISENKIYYDGVNCLQF